MAIDFIDQQKQRSKLLQKEKAVRILPKTPGTPLGLYARLKVRQEYLQVGLYEAGDDGAEDIIGYKDEDPPEDRFTHFGFGLEGLDNR